MADPVISVLLENLVAIAEKKVTEEINLVKRVRGEVLKLSIKLRDIQSVLDDAEKRRVQEEIVKNWMKELEDVVCDMDDVIDEWHTRIIKKKIGVGKDKKKVTCSSVLPPFGCFKRVSSRREIAVKVKELNERLDFITESKKKLFDFHPSNVEDSLEKFKPIETTSLIDESRVCGRDADKESLVQRLLSENRDTEQNLLIISIVGKGGSGKTTLAQLAYNTEEVNSHFDHKIWVYVSNPIDEIQIAKTILTYITNKTSTAATLDQMHLEIHEVVSKTRILLVLDDVWSQANTTWEQLILCFKDVASGSRVLVTTRDERVAKIMGTTELNMIKLQELIDDHCWLLIQSIALAHVDAADRNNFVDIGRKISRKCQGLPLAAKVIGNILLFKETKDQWSDVLNSKIWELEKVEKELFPHLFLSYSELTPAMRRCFRYCSIFKKGETIEVDMLIRLWMAQGYLSSNGIQDRMEQIGYEYLEHLSMISFFDDLVKDKATGRIVACKMHDIVHEFLQYLGKDEFLIIVEEQIDDKNGKQLNIVGPEYCRHLSLLSTNPKDLTLSSCNMDKLRTMSIQTLWDNLNWSLSCETLRRLKSIRVMKLNNCGELELPLEIGNLTRLRFMDLSNNKLLKLPDTVCNLCNLQSLYLRFCDNLSELPHRIDQLINLRNLVTDGSEHMLLPERFEKLTELQTMSQFVVGRGNELRLLEKLNQISGSLQIVIYNQVQLNKDDAERAGLRNKHRVELFRLDINSDVEMDVIEALHIPPRLQQLKLYIIHNNWYPTWMLSSALDNLRHLVFSCGCDCSSLPPLRKLQSLEILEITNNKLLKRLDLNFFGISYEQDSDISSSAAADNHLPFPKLTKLFFKSCENWEVWEDATFWWNVEVTFNVKTTCMPYLRELIIEDCNKLETLPLRLLLVSQTRRVKWDDFIIESDEDHERVKYQRDIKLGRLRRSELEKRRVAVLVSKAALDFIAGRK